jgi:TatD DNase family protein
VFDSHCHFDFQPFDQDRAELWQHCLAAGIEQLLIPGVEPEQWQKAAAICQQYPGIYYAAGLHPWWQGDYPHSTQTLIDNLSAELRNDACRAIGECGLDALIDTSMAEQLGVFDAQLMLAESLNKPVIIHVRKAHQHVLGLLKRYSLSAGGVIHAFSGSLELAQAYWQQGFCLGVGATISYPRASKTRHAIAAMPIESLLLETDAPDMPLSGRQGQRNSPLYLPDIAELLAELKQCRLADIQQKTTDNSRRLFQLSE